MICALCLNPCVDKTITIHGFSYGEMNRIQHVRRDGSGKGVNVAIAAKSLGHQAHLVGFGTEGDNLVQQRLLASDVDCTMVQAFDTIRVNTKVLNTEDHVITELNESGARVSDQHIKAVVRHTIHQAKESDFMVLTGSMPPGCDATLYARLIADVQREAPHCHCVLDAEGEVFRSGVEAGPYMVKPNRYELEMYMGEELSTLSAVKAAGQALLQKGITIVLISMGSEGAMLVTSDGCHYAPPMDVTVKSTVGAGDSMTVGMLCALEDGYSAAEAFRHSVAAASSAVMTEGTGLIDPVIYKDLIPKVTMEAIND